MSADIKPFKVAIPDSELAKLQAKLEITSFPLETSFSNDWNRGAVQEDVKRLVSRWRNGFDWRAVEKRLNELPQFSTSIDVDGFGHLGLHFVHQKSKRADAIPLLFCHGWPGGYWEVAKLLPLLTEDKNGDPSFHVVAPSLPNFGFSEAPTKEGFGGPQYAEAMHKLMLRLGYDKYVTQGGDWGYRVTRYLGKLYPDHVLASHLNLILARPPTLTEYPWLYLQYLVTPFSVAEKAGLERTKWFNDLGAGYNLLQSTKPATIGFALADSPVGLLAWMYEKLHDWTDSYPWADDEVLTWASLYLFSQFGAAASSQIYYETQRRGWFSKERDETQRWNGSVKLGLAYFPQDIHCLPSVYGRTLGPVVFERRHERGGHFAAHEVPELLAGDLKEMFALSKGGFGIEVLKRLGETR